MRKGWVVEPILLHFRTFSLKPEFIPQFFNSLLTVFKARFFSSKYFAFRD
jgi:hypothetical protein